MRATLLAGQYSLLLGAGVSFDCLDRQGTKLLSPQQLRTDLISKKGLKDTSSLARAYAQLSQAEIDTWITDRYENCKPGPTAKQITKFFWKSVYTFNIDDSLDTAYKDGDSVQQADSLTHRSDFSSLGDPNSVALVHVHGWAKKAEDGYVFSLAEYAETLGAGFPWTQILFQTLRTDPFIVAGTSLDEPDLEFFLQARKASTVRRDRGPSFLVEPQPDSGTLRDCERFGLTLYEGTLDQFLDSIAVAFPDRPLPLGASKPLTEDFFDSKVTKKELALLARDFRHQIARQAADDGDLAYFVGRPPTDTDIALGRDVARADTAPIKNRIRERIRKKEWSPNFLYFEDGAGEGKTTIVARVAYDLAAEGVHVFHFPALRAPDLANAAKLFTAFKGAFVIIADNFADSVGVVAELYRLVAREDFLILATERGYRSNYIYQSMAGIGIERLYSSRLNREEASDLIAKMEAYGLTASSTKTGPQNPHASELLNDSIAVAVCRILNNYQPIERIVDTLVDDADEDRLKSYLTCALAYYCARPGLGYSVLSSVVAGRHLQDQLKIRDVLPLTYFDNATRDYIIPANPVLSFRILLKIRDGDPALLLEIYQALGAALAPYVNRKAIRSRSPEARLAGRLFDYDEVVSQLLGERAEDFFLAMRRFWEWNSRYWEQFALLKLDQSKGAAAKDRDAILQQAISHARHAVRTERHPLPLTTLGHVLLEAMRYNPVRRDTLFQEAYEYLDEAIGIEGRASRITIHPFSVLFGAVNYFVENGGKLSGAQTEKMLNRVAEAHALFPSDTALGDRAELTRKLLSR